MGKPVILILLLMLELQVSALQLPCLSNNGAAWNAVDYGPLYELRHAHQAVVCEASKPLDQVRVLTSAQTSEYYVTIMCRRGAAMVLALDD
jgi:hypothetical protein